MTPAPSGWTVGEGCQWSRLVWLLHALLHTPADTLCMFILRGLLYGQCGRRADDALCDSPPCLWILLLAFINDVPYLYGTGSFWLSGLSYMVAPQVPGFKTCLVPDPVP